VRTLEAKNCKALAAMWIEDPPSAAAEEEEDDEGEEGGRGGDGGGDVNNKGPVRVDVRNCSSLERLVGVRAAATEGRLSVDLRGCTSLPPSARPPVNQ
jgi:hypothetical protein